MTVALAVQCWIHREWLGLYDDFSLPAFDAHVYRAMAEHPAVFTVAPWGYRLLMPWLVHALPLSPADSFRLVTATALVLAGGLLFLFLRRLGHGETASVLAVGAFGLAPPVSECVTAPFLVEPVMLALQVGFLLAIEAGAGVGVMALLATLGALTKELMIPLVPLVYFARRERSGDGRALVETVLVALPAVVVTLVLRAWWTPETHLPLPRLDPHRLGAFLELLRSTWKDWLRLLLVGGLGPLAVLGAFRPAGRAFLRRYGYLLAMPAGLLALTPYDFGVRYFVADLPRVLLYLLPGLIPLCLVAVDRWRPHMQPAPPPAAPRPRIELAAALAVAAIPVLLVLTLDRYRRIDLQGRRDGMLVLGLTLGSLDTAKRVERDRAAIFRMAEHRFEPGRFDTAFLTRMRWFLREGWGPDPYYGVAEVFMEADRASLLLPCYTPQDLDFAFHMSAAAPTTMRVEVNGRVLGDVALATEVRKLVVPVPAEALFRGDNIVTFVVRDAAASRPRLYQVSISRSSH